MKLNLDAEYSKLNQEKEKANVEIKAIDTRIKIFQLLGWLSIMAGFILGLIGIFVFASGETYRLNEVGDFLGGTVATFWSLAGLFFIYIAFLGQQKQMLYQNLELSHSRLELNATRIELKGQKEQLIEQNKVIQLQRFENTFFKMLSMLQDLVDNIKREKIKGPDIRYQIHSAIQNRPTQSHLYQINGKRCFIDFFEALKKKYEELLQEKYGEEKGSQMIMEDELSFIKEAYTDVYKENEADLRHYFQSIFQIMNLIENASIDDRSTYVEIFRAQFSTHELLMIFYFSLSDFGKDWLTDFLEKYRFLKLFDGRQLLNIEHRKISIKTFFLS